MDCNTPGLLFFNIPRVCSNSCALTQGCYLTISSSATLFSFCLQPFPASGSFPVSSIDVYIQLIHLLQKLMKHCKAIRLQLKTKKKITIQFLKIVASNQGKTPKSVLLAPSHYLSNLIYFCTSSQQNCQVIPISSSSYYNWIDFLTQSIGCLQFACLLCSWPHLSISCCK